MENLYRCRQCSGHGVLKGQEGKMNEITLLFDSPAGPAQFEYKLKENERIIFLSAPVDVVLETTENCCLIDSGKRTRSSGGRKWIEKWILLETLPNRKAQICWDRWGNNYPVDIVKYATTFCGKDTTRTMIKRVWPKET